jgi:ribosomal protein S3
MKNILNKNLNKYFLPEGNNLTTYHSFDKGFKNIHILNATRTRIKLISKFFSPINRLRGKPVFTVTSDKIIIRVFYYIPKNKHIINNNTINNLGETLSSIFKKSVELQLIKLNNPYLDSYILAQYIALNTQDYTLVQIMRRVFNSVLLNSMFIKNVTSLLPSHIIGIKVQVSGRLSMEPSRPRQTVQTMQIGSFSKSNNSLVDSAMFTTKNKKGAFTVKVWISQKFVN